MRSSLTRPKFDLAFDAAGLPPELREPIWTALRAVLTGRLRQDPQILRGWTPDARALREPLRREIDACCKRDSEGTLLNRFEGLSVNLPAPNNQQPRAFNVMRMFEAYRESLVNIRTRMDDALRDGNHWRTLDNLSTEPQPLDIIVSNVKALGGYAGTLNWVQWELPRNYGLISKVFDEANTNYRAARKWTPYSISTSALGDRGKAANQRRVNAWVGALRELVYEMHDVLRERAALNPGAERLAAFYATLKSNTGMLEPKLMAAVFEAATQQARAHRTPANPAFAPPNSIWHVLPVPLRLDLAARYAVVLREAHEAMLAEGEPELAAAFNPAHTFNPWALTQEELARHSAG